MLFFQKIFLNLQSTEDLKKCELSQEFGIYAAVSGSVAT